MDKIIINGKKYTFGGWAICAYEFIKYEKPTKVMDYIEVIKKSKELRKRDFVKEASIKMANFLQNYEKKFYKMDSGCHFVSELNSDFMIEFSNSDIMQADINILIDIINNIQKLYTYLNIPFIKRVEEINENEGEREEINENEGEREEINERENEIIHIENMQLYLINLINANI
jgi:hypothetical protein